MDKALARELANKAHGFLHAHLIQELDGDALRLWPRRRTMLDFSGTIFLLATDFSAFLLAIPFPPGKMGY
jgi:hypothetical protein